MPSPSATAHLVSYDLPSTVSGNRRRSRLAHLLERRGIRVQWSIFECALSAPRMEELKTDALQMIDRRQDSLRIYPLCASCLALRETYEALDKPEIAEPCFLF